MHDKAARETHHGKHLLLFPLLAVKINHYILKAWCSFSLKTGVWQNSIFGWNARFEISKHSCNLHYWASTGFCQALTSAVVMPGKSQYSAVPQSMWLPSSGDLRRHERNQGQGIPGQGKAGEEAWQGKVGPSAEASLDPEPRKMGSSRFGCVFGFLFWFLMDFCCGSFKSFQISS